MEPSRGKSIYVPFESEDPYAICVADPDGFRQYLKHCLYSKYYEKFEPFKQAITDCLALTSTNYKNELKSLLTLNFQAFEKAQIVTV